MGRLVDTHCHLDLLKSSVLDALEGATAANVEAVITIGIDAASSRRAIGLAHAHEQVYATVGLHPHDARLWNGRLVAELERMARDDRVVAVGECGLDYYRTLSAQDAQREAFVGQMHVARAAGKPLVVHVRDAADEAMDLLADHAAGLTVVLHCFSAPETLVECVRRGYYLSFAGNVTYKSAGALREAAQRAPAERLLLETDAPFLTPVPFRGKSNLPERVVLTASAIAELRGLSAVELADRTTENARRAFSLPILTSTV